MRRPLGALTAVGVTLAILGTADTAGAAGVDPVEPFGYVRLLHGDVRVAGRPVDVSVDDVAAGQAAWAGASPWRVVAPGPHRLTATGGTDVTVDVGAGCGVTVVTGQADLSGRSPRAVVVPDCRPARLAPGEARVTAVVLTNPSFGAVQVEINGGHQRVEPFIAVPGTVLGAGDAHLTLRHPDTGAVYLRRDLHLDDGRGYTVALVGGGEAGTALAVAEDAAQALVMPPAGEAIHTGLQDRSALIPLAVAVAAALCLAALHRAHRRHVAVAGVVVALSTLLVGCRPGDGAVAKPTRPASKQRHVSVTRPTPSDPAPSVSADPDAAGVSVAPAAPPASLRIARLGLDLPVGRLDGVRGLPRSLPLRDVAWLTGTSPAGATGTTAILGHTGSGPFASLDRVRPGDLITITDSAGRVHTYTAVSVSSHPKQSFPQEVWAPQRVPTLVVVTCTGERDPRTQLHRDNLVVRAIGT